MKKLLIASTALVALTGTSFADGHAGVAISGSAEMGIAGKTGTSIQFHQDIDVTFKMTGESDNGLTFGAAVDLDEAGNLGDSNVNQGVAIFVSGEFGTVTLGDTDGALDWALSESALAGGSITDDETSHAGYLGSYGDGSGGDNQVLRYDNTFGDFGVAVSVESDRVGADTLPAGSPATGDYGYALGLKYNLDLGGTTVALGLGYQSTVIDEKIVGISAMASMGNGFSANIVYSDWSDSVNDSAIGIGVGYSSGPIAVGVNYGKKSLAAGGDVDGFGVAATYDLGGGLSFKAGYGSDDAVKRGSLGLGMSF